jgi:sodium transport system permease protein
MGKFLTVMLASVLTALLNLVSMGLTGLRLAGHVGSLAASPGRRAAGFAAATLAAPTPQAALWMLVLLIPLAAFFSAVCVALAVLARSMKEGQYYMTPLYLISMPLIFLSLAPEIELNLFYSLVPITGVALLLRALILGSYDAAFRYFLPVMLPMLVYAAVALRWAIDQFQREDVLFREAERFNVSTWIRHLYRDREPTPTAAQAVLCFALILASSWFYLMYHGEPAGGLKPSDAAVSQLFIVIPPIIMAVFLTSSPARTLRLSWPEPRYLLMAAALAFTLNPIINELEPYVERLFPISEAIKKALGQLMGPSTGWATMVAVFALVPAVCEELAFRGFILSGLERQHRTRSAILLSALMFGFLHVLMSLFQQLFNATLLGIVLGLLAVRSRSILPGIIFHFLNNAMAVSRGYWIEHGAEGTIAGWIYRNPRDGLYHGTWVAAGLVLSCALLYSLWRRDRGRPGRPAEADSPPADALCRVGATPPGPG